MTNNELGEIRAARNGWVSQREVTTAFGRVSALPRLGEW